MASSAFTPPPHALRFGPVSAGDPVVALLEKAGVAVIELPPTAPATPAELRQLTRQAGFVLLDLDQGAAALAWQRALRTHRPALPILGLYANADLAELLVAGRAGLDRAIKLSSSTTALAHLFAPWLPASSADAATTALPVVETRKNGHVAAHLSPASEANQSLLNVLAQNPGATRVIVRGPVGSEFTLVALEIASGHKIDESEIAFDWYPKKTSPGPRFLVTRDAATFRTTAVPVALLIEETDATDPGTLSGDTGILLQLAPLNQRPADTAHYIHRWLPVLAAAAGNPAIMLPLHPEWRHALLADMWPGQFAGLWRVLQRLALLTPGSTLPRPLAPPPGTVFDFESLTSVATPRAHRAWLARRVPKGLLSSVLLALGCPELPADHD